MKIILSTLVLSWIALFAMAQQLPYRERINLAGEWGIWLSPSSIGEAVTVALALAWNQAYVETPAVVIASNPIMTLVINPALALLILLL